MIHCINGLIDTLIPVVLDIKHSDIMYSIGVGNIYGLILIPNNIQTPILVTHVWMYKRFNKPLIVLIVPDEGDTIRFNPSWCWHRFCLEKYVNIMVSEAMALITRYDVYCVG